MVSVGPLPDKAIEPIVELPLYNVKLLDEAGPGAEGLYEIAIEHVVEIVLREALVPQLFPLKEKSDEPVRPT